MFVETTETKRYTQKIIRKKRFDFQNFDAFLQQFESTKSPKKNISKIDKIAYEL